MGLAGNQARLWNLRGRGQSSAALVNTDQIDAQHAPLPTAEIDAAPLNITAQKHTRLNVQNGSRQAQTVRLHQPSNPNAVTRSEHVLREPSRANIVLTRRDNTGPSRNPLGFRFRWRSKRAEVLPHALPKFLAFFRRHLRPPLGHPRPPVSPAMEPRPPHEATEENLT